MLALLERWGHLFPREGTFVQTKYDVPALMARFDGILEPDGSFFSYEIQDGTGWLGYAGLVNARLKEMRDHFVSEKWPPFKLLMADGDEHDDVLWIERVSFDEALRNADILLQIRNSLWSLDADDAAALISRSIIPVYFHNNKSYGEQFGWWKRVDWDREGVRGELPWDTAFVLKPIWGWTTKGVMLWTPGSRRGSSTRTQILKTFEAFGSMYLQPYRAPMHMEIDGRLYNIMLRPFFAYDPTAKKWSPWGGVWTGRPHPAFRLHGASDAITGPLYIES